MPSNHRAEGERQIEREEYEGAVKNFRAALELADRANVEGRGSIDYARTLFLMGRALLKLRKYAEAETALREAMDSFMPDADIAHVRDCLGRALESQGKLGPARDTRQSDPLVCSYESVRAQSLVDADGALCPRSNELFAFSALQACGRCKCIYYHDRECASTLVGLG